LIWIMIARRSVKLNARMKSGRVAEIPFSVREVVDQRVSKRFVVDIEFDAQLSDKSCLALVYDLSRDGCMIEVQDGEFESGDRIVLDFRPLARAAGQLVWCIGRSCGVQFNEPLHTSVVEEFGFRPDPPGFDEAWLRDRFGRAVSKARGRSRSFLNL